MLEMEQEELRSKKDVRRNYVSPCEVLRHRVAARNETSAVVWQGRGKNITTTVDAYVMPDSHRPPDKSFFHVFMS